jgi:thiamine-monophosphate kinase
MIATTDALVEGNHWRTDTMSWADVGWRAIAANVSDIAAMGARPRFALVALTLGTSLTPDALDCLVEGMAEACRAHEVRIAGGDTIRGRETNIAVTLLGEAASTSGDGLLLRSAARVGDAVAVSGHPGASASGLALIEARRATEAGVEPLLEAHRRPRARVALGRAAVEAAVRCAIDVSDGLLQDLGHIAERSGAGIEVDLDALPLHPAAIAALGLEAAREHALGGGEDYELALCGPAGALARLATAELPVTVIGRVIEAHRGEAWALASDGTRHIPAREGWDQLATKSPEA